MASVGAKTTVYFDGSCALCRTEIGYYRRQDQADAFCFVDVSAAGAITPTGVSQQRAMERFHVRAGDGRVLSGAAAFVAAGVGSLHPLHNLISASAHAVGRMVVVRSNRELPSSHGCTPSGRSGNSSDLCG